MKGTEKCHWAELADTPLVCLALYWLTYTEARLISISLFLFLNSFFGFFFLAMDWMFITLNPFCVMVLEGGAFGSWLGQEGCHALPGGAAQSDEDRNWLHGWSTAGANTEMRGSGSGTRSGVEAGRILRFMLEKANTAVNRPLRVILVSIQKEKGSAVEDSQHSQGMPKSPWRQCS